MKQVKNLEDEIDERKIEPDTLLDDDDGIIIVYDETVNKWVCLDDIERNDRYDDIKNNKRI